jgi:hypothetical protein
VAADLENSGSALPHVGRVWPLVAGFHGGGAADALHSPCANITTSTRYLNIQGRQLHRHMEQVEQHRAKVAQRLHNDGKTSPATVSEADTISAGKTLVS